mmetsp:Transcript_24155/g.63026  ORF Transcript_24155/g.63026 Transcript_24155/m.63026 type:complete len:258 (+) Transcript_24155:933-1706(+)
MYLASKRGSTFSPFGCTSLAASSWPRQLKRNMNVPVCLSFANASWHSLTVSAQMPSILLRTWRPRYPVCRCFCFTMLERYCASATTRSMVLSGASRSWLFSASRSSCCTTMRSGLEKVMPKPPRCSGSEVPKPTLRGPSTWSCSRHALKPPGAQPRSKKRGWATVPTGVAMAAQRTTSAPSVAKSRWSKSSCMTPKDLWKCTSVSAGLCIGCQHASAGGGGAAGCCHPAPPRLRPELLAGAGTIVGGGDMEIHVSGS